MEPSPDIHSGFSLAADKVRSWTADFYAMLPNLVVGIVILALFVFAAKGVHRLALAYFKRRARPDLGRLVADFGFWGMILLGVLVMLTIVIPSLKPVDILGGLGFGSLAFGFAFKDILQNWLAGLLILLRLPFRRGDQISVAGMEGTVQAIEPRATIIRTYDGRDVVIPNTTIYTNTVTIHTSQKTRRTEIDITVGYDHDIAHISGIIEQAMKPLQEVMDEPPPQILCWDLGSTSLGLKIRWWIKSEKAQEIVSRARVVQAIKEAFAANDIDPTDPQLIFYQSAVKENAAPFESRNAGASAKIGRVVETPPPPEMAISPHDPEADKPKLDDKDETLLPAQ